MCSCSDSVWLEVKEGEGKKPHKQPTTQLETVWFFSKSKQTKKWEGGGEKKSQDEDQELGNLSKL